MLKVGPFMLLQKRDVLDGKDNIRYWLHRPTRLYIPLIEDYHFTGSQPAQVAKANQPHYECFLCQVGTGSWGFQPGSKRSDIMVTKFSCVCPFESIENVKCIGHVGTVNDLAKAKAAKEEGLRERPKPVRSPISYLGRK